MTTTGSGQYTEVNGDNVDARRASLEVEAKSPGDDHIWVFTTMYRLSEENAERAARGDQVQLDNENLVMAAGPICWRCESPQFNKYPCPGYRRVVMSELVEGSGG